MAQALQSRISEVFAVDIHPAARIGKGILVDHATGLVIGETAVVGDYCSILQGVTLGGTGKQHGDRHPKVREGVLIGAYATVLGNIEIGTGSQIAAGSLVLKDVNPHEMVAGSPAVVVGAVRGKPALQMEQWKKGLEKCVFGSLDRDAGAGAALAQAGGAGPVPAGGGGVAPGGGAPGNGSDDDAYYDHPGNFTI